MLAVSDAPFRRGAVLTAGLSGCPTSASLEILFSGGSCAAGGPVEPKQLPISVDNRARNRRRDSRFVGLFKSRFACGASESLRTSTSINDQLLRLRQCRNTRWSRIYLRYLPFQKSESAVIQVVCSWNFKSDRRQRCEELLIGRLLLTWQRQIVNLSIVGVPTSTVPQ